MLTKDDLEQIANLLKPINEKLDTVDMKVELVNSNLAKTQEQVVDTIIRTTDDILAEVKKQHGNLEKRIEQLEEDQLSTRKN